jgi:hypothetical protein
VARTKSFNLCENFFQAHFLPTEERVGRIAVPAAKRASGKANKNCWQADSVCLTLQRKKNLCDSEFNGHRKTQIKKPGDARFSSRPQKLIPRLLQALAQRRREQGDQ